MDTDDNLVEEPVQNLKFDTFFFSKAQGYLETTELILGMFSPSRRTTGEGITVHEGKQLGFALTRSFLMDYACFVLIQIWMI